MTLAKAGSGRRLERETECDDGVNVKGQNRDRGSAHCDARAGVGHQVKGRSFKRRT